MSSSILKSRTNPLVSLVRTVREGKEKTFFFCEGIKLINELFAAPYTITHLITIEKFHRELKKLVNASGKTHVPITVVTESVMEALSDLATPAGSIALAKRENLPNKITTPLTGDLFLVLTHVQLPQNLGAMIRTAEATGVNEIWLGPGSADPWSPKCIRGSTGSIFRMRIRRGVPVAESLALLKSNGFQILGALQSGTVRYEQVDWSTPSALVMGSEGFGLAKENLSVFDQTIMIPMKGHVESLNLGTAAAVCLFEAVRQRQAREKNR